MAPGCVAQLWRDAFAARKALLTVFGAVSEFINYRKIAIAKQSSQKTLLRK
jgi:hypothetical protein